MDNELMMNETSGQLYRVPQRFLSSSFNQSVIKQVLV